MNSKKHRFVGRKASNCQGFRQYAPHFFSPSGMYPVVKDLLKAELFEGKVIYPPKPLRVFKEVPFHDVRVVILGQDPYHNGLADGLAFSTLPHNPIPASLRRIFQELCADLDCPMPSTGDLSEWAKRGILLLNTSLTVEKRRPNSHAEIGWHYGTRECLARLNDLKKGLVFMLWGGNANRFKWIFNQDKHLVLSHCHPSPFTGDEWFGHKHFSQACDYLNVGSEFWKLR